MILRAMADAGVGPEATVMVGDTTFDIEMARSARVGAIGVGWGYHTPEQLVRAGAHVVAESGDVLVGDHRGASWLRRRSDEESGRSRRARCRSGSTNRPASSRRASGEHRVQLDGRAVRTPAKAELAVPSAALAQAIAAEWDAQGEHIDPTSMPLTRLANSAIDGVRRAQAEVRADIARYAASDLLCYRAEAPDELSSGRARPGTRFCAGRTSNWARVLRSAPA